MEAHGEDVSLHVSGYLALYHKVKDWCLFSKVNKPPWLGPYQLENNLPVFCQYSNTLTQQDHRNEEVADCGTLKLQ